MCATPEWTQDCLKEEVVKNLSNDYKYNYKFCKAIARGSVYFTLKDNLPMITASPGKYHQARWLPLFNRCFREYVQTKKPSRKLTLLVTFFTQVISPAWFNAIANPSFLEGPRNFHKLVSDINTFDLKDHAEDYDKEDEEEEETEDHEEEEDQDHVDKEEEYHQSIGDKEGEEESESEAEAKKKPKAKKKLPLREALQAVLSNNSYFAHFESVVAAMMFDKDPKIRQKGLQEVLGLLHKQEEQDAEERRRRKEGDNTQDEEHRPKKRKLSRPKKVPVLAKKVREFHSPQVDLTVPNYWNFIDNTPEAEKTMPPIFIGLGEAELRNIATDPSTSSLNHLYKINGNTQNVERWIKNITQISEHVKSSQRREEEAANLQYSRIIMPHRYDSKKDYVSHLSIPDFATQQPPCRPASKPASQPTRTLSSASKKKKPPVPPTGLCASCRCPL